MPMIQENVTAGDNVTRDSVLAHDSPFNAHDVFPDGVNHSVVLGVLTILAVSSIVGNFWICNTIIRHKNLHKPPYSIVMSVCLADLCKTLLCMPFVIFCAYHKYKWVYTQNSCVIVAFLNSLFTFSTLTGLLALVIDRYVSVTAPRFYKKCSDVPVQRAVISLGWGVAFCLSFPAVFEEDAYRFIPAEMQCTFYHLPYTENVTLGYTLAFVFILSAIAFIYCRLFFFLRSHRRMAPLFHEPARSSNWTFFGPGANGQALVNLLNGFAGRPVNPFTGAVRNMQQNFGRVVNLRVAKNEHLTRVFCTASGLYILLWIPYLCQVFMKVFCLKCAVSSQFVVIATTISYGHLSLCPCVYILIGNPIKDSIIKQLREWYSQHVYTGVSQAEPPIAEPSVQCIELGL